MLAQGKYRKNPNLRDLRGNIVAKKLIKSHGRRPPPTCKTRTVAAFNSAKKSRPSAKVDCRCVPHRLILVGRVVRHQNEVFFFVGA